MNERNDLSKFILKRIKGLCGSIYCAISVVILVTLVATVIMASFFSSLYFREECLILSLALIPAFLHVLAVTLMQVQKERAGNGLSILLQIIKLLAALLIMSVAVFLCVYSLNKTPDEYYNFLSKYIPDFFSINVRNVGINSLLVSFAVLAVGSFFAVFHSIYYLCFLFTLRNVYKNKFNGIGLRGLGRVSFMIVIIQAGVYLSQLLDYPRYSGKAFEGLSTFSLFDWFVTAINFFIILSMLTLAIIAFRTDSAIKGVNASIYEQGHNGNCPKGHKANVPVSEQGEDDKITQVTPMPESSNTPVFEHHHEQHETYNSYDNINDTLVTDQLDSTDIPDDDTTNFPNDTYIPVPAHTTTWDNDFDDDDSFLDIEDNYDSFDYLSPDIHPHTDSIKDHTSDLIPYLKDSIIIESVDLQNEPPIKDYISKGNTCVDYGYSENEII